MATTATPAGGADYDYSLPAALPLETARITLAGSNSVARYALLDHDGADDTLLASGTALRVGADASGVTSVAFAQRRVQHLRLHVDTALAQPPSLAVGWRPEVFVFLSEGSGPYSLLAGSYSARRSGYPLRAALKRIRPAGSSANWQPPLAALGAASVAGGAAALRAPKAPFDWTQSLLWLVLVAGALAVAAMAWSLLRQAPRKDDAP